MSLESLFSFFMESHLIHSLTSAKQNIVLGLLEYMKGLELKKGIEIST